MFNAYSIDRTAWRSLLALMSILVSTSAAAGCPDPANIHPQAILFGSGQIEGQPLLVRRADSGPTYWISSNYQSPAKWVQPILRKVQIASLEPDQHALVCIYSFGEDLVFSRFRMYEPITDSMTRRIELNNEDEWHTYVTNEKGKYGYMCETSRAKCEWGYKP